MSLAIVFEKIRKLLCIMKNGEIRLLVRDGQVKYINTVREYFSEEDEEQYNPTRF